MLGKVRRILLIIFFAFAFILANAQMSYQLDKSRNERSWFTSINAGYTSYYGNLAVYNYDPILKLKKESKFAIGLTAGKSFNQFFSARFYFTMGGLKAYNNERLIRMDAKMNNYGVQLMVNFTTVITQMDYVPDFYFYGIGGAGMAATKPVIYNIPDDLPLDSLNIATIASAFELNAGLGLSYNLLRNFDVNVELIYHYSLSSELDLISEAKKDSFMHLNGGITYRFGFPGNKGSSAFSRRRR